MSQEAILFTGISGNSTNSHFYTRDKNELGDGKEDFVYEGVAFIQRKVPQRL